MAGGVRHRCRSTHLSWCWRRACLPRAIPPSEVDAPGEPACGRRRTCQRPAFRATPLAASRSRPKSRGCHVRPPNSPGRSTSFARSAPRDESQTPRAKQSRPPPALRRPSEVEHLGDRRRRRSPPPRRTAFSTRHTAIDTLIWRSALSEDGAHQIDGEKVVSGLQLESAG